MIRSLTLPLMVAGLLFVGATIGVNAASYQDAEVTPEDMGFNETVSGNLSHINDEVPGPGPDNRAERELTEGVVYYVASWLTVVSTWSYHNPGFARAFLLNAPWIIIIAVALRYLAHAALILYVIAAERGADD